MDFYYLHLLIIIKRILILSEWTTKIRKLVLEIRGWYYSGKTLNYRIYSTKLIHINLANYLIVGKVWLQHYTTFYFLLLFIILLIHLKALIIYKLMIIIIVFRHSLFIFHQIFKIRINFCSWAWPRTAVAFIRSIRMVINILIGRI